MKVDLNIYDEKKERKIDVKIDVKIDTCIV